MEALAADGALLISAGTVAEALIVAARRNVGEEMERLIGGLGFEIVDVTADSAQRIAQAYEQWEKGIHPAALNFGDCFAYEIAKEHGCRLLHVGGTFPGQILALTNRSPDGQSALRPASFATRAHLAMSSAT